MSIKLVEHFSVNNDCYKSNINKINSQYIEFQKNGPKGGMLHSVGTNQPKASVFANSWNKSGKKVAVHAVIQQDGTGFQCLPWNFRGWHAGGSANNTHIGVEMTEPACIKYIGGATFTCSDVEAAKAHTIGCYNSAVELFAQLANEYGWNPLTDIISHSEGYKKGVASNHADPEHLWKQLGLPYTMDTFRKDVKKLMDVSSEQIYRIRKSWENSSSQIGAYSILENAKRACKDGYYVFDEDGNIVYPENKEHPKKLCDKVCPYCPYQNK